jgi:hypothetical protein
MAYTKAIYKKVVDRMDRLKFIGGIILLYVACTVVVVTLYVIRTYYDDEFARDQVQWLATMELQCPGISTEVMKFQHKALQDSGVINIPIFICLSLYYTGGSYLPSSYPSSIKFRTHVFRVLTVAIVCLPPLICAVVVGRLSGFATVTYVMVCQVGLALFSF